MSLSIAALLLAGAKPSIAQTTRPTQTHPIVASPPMVAAPIRAGEYDSVPLRREDRSSPAGSTTNPTTHSARVGDAVKLAPTFDVTRVLGALLAVVGLIFALKWIGRRFFPNVVAPRGAGIVRVLARTPVSTKQQVVLVQVGKRVIVAADNGAQLTSLSEISDADEVAAILGQLSNDPISKERFGAAFVTAQNGFDEKLGARTTVPSPAADSEDEEADESITSDETDVAAAKGELEGLMNKIRGLAKQLGRT